MLSKVKAEVVEITEGELDDEAIKFNCNCCEFQGTCQKSQPQALQTHTIGVGFS